MVNLAGALRLPDLDSLIVELTRDHFQAHQIRELSIPRANLGDRGLKALMTLVEKTENSLIKLDLSWN